MIAVDNRSSLVPLPLHWARGHTGLMEKCVAMEKTVFGRLGSKVELIPLTPAVGVMDLAVAQLLDTRIVSQNNAGTTECKPD